MVHTLHSISRVYKVFLFMTDSIATPSPYINYKITVCPLILFKFDASFCRLKQQDLTLSILPDQAV